MPSTKCKLVAEAIGSQGPGAVLYKLFMAKPREAPLPGFGAAEPLAEEIDLCTPDATRLGLDIATAPIGAGGGVYALKAIVRLVQMLGLRTGVWDGSAVMFALFWMKTAYTPTDSCVIIEQYASEDDFVRVRLRRQDRKSHTAKVAKPIAESFVAAWRQAGQAASAD